MGAHYRHINEPSFREKFYTNIAPIITGVGASVAIVGALFKIMHWPGATFFLVAGLSAEAVLFFLFAFAPIPADPDWTIVYPELGYDGDENTSIKESEKPNGKNLVKKLDHMLESANLNQDVINKFSAGIQSLTSTVSNMNDLSSAAVASSEYAQNVKQASKSIVDMNKSYAVTVEAMSSMASASTDAKEYHSQVQNITKNLGALNAVYEMELQDANNHLKAMNKFYSNLSTAMENMSEASKDTHQFKQELAKLTGNLTALNNVYGNMLSAMRG
ncbi:MAG: gliding motility protein GldL [Cytophagales bacterium]